MDVRIFEVVVRVFGRGSLSLLEDLFEFLHSGLA